jgi:hypothetical protein
MAHIVIDFENDVLRYFRTPLLKERHQHALPIHEDAMAAMIFLPPYYGALLAT